MKNLIILLWIVLFASCTTVKPHIAEYRINPMLEKTPEKSSRCNKKSLKVAQAFSTSSLMLKDMSYALGNYKKDLFTQSQWAESPNKAITAEILKMLQQSKIFKSVQIAQSRSRSGLLLETNIEEFIQHFSNDEKHSSVHVVINMTLIDLKTNSVLSSKTFSQVLEVTTINAEGGVIALNKALSQVMIEQRDWMREICQ